MLHQPARETHMLDLPTHGNLRDRKAKIGTVMREVLERFTQEIRLLLLTRDRLHGQVNQRTNPRIVRGLVLLVIFLLAGISMFARGELDTDDSMTRIDALKTKISMSFPTVPMVTALQLEEQLKAPSTAPILLDTRTKAEFKVSHLGGAIHIAPAPNAAEAIARQFSPDKQIVIYCSVGYRSAEIVLRLREMGFLHASSLIGGIFEWANRGLPIVSETGPASTVHPYNKKWGQYLEHSLHPR